MILYECCSLCALTFLVHTNLPASCRIVSSKAQNTKAGKFLRQFEDAGKKVRGCYAKIIRAQPKYIFANLILWSVKHYPKTTR